MFEFFAPTFGGPHFVGYDGSMFFLATHAHPSSPSFIWGEEVANLQQRLQ
jgi:hypothetical protein